jgi:hypothetical protein
LTLAQLNLGGVPALTGEARFYNAAVVAAVRNFGNTADVNLLGVSTAGSDYAQIAAGQSLTLGLSAPAVGATAGFPYLPATAGVPTGVPTAIAGYAPVQVDSTDSRLYFYSGGAWQNTTNVVLTDQQVAIGEAVNSVAETNLYSVSLPINTLLAGRYMLMEMLGDILQNAGSGLTIRVYLGATKLFDTAGLSLTNSAARQAWWLTIKIFAIAVNSQIAYYQSPYANAVTGVNPVGTQPQDTIALLREFHGENTSTEDNSAGARLFRVTAQWAVASLSASARSLGVKTLVYA